MRTTTFRWFLLGYGLDRWADMLWTTTLAWLASSAPSPALSGLILSAAFLPHVAALLLGGVQADRRDPGNIAQQTTLAKMVLLAALLVVQGAVTESLVVVAVVAALLAAVDGFHDTAVDTWGMHLRPQDEQQQAVAAESTVFRVAQSLGAALGGLLVGIGAVYALGAGVLLMTCARAVFARVGHRQAVDRAGVAAESSGWAQMRAGLAFLRGHPVLPTTLTVQVVTTVTSGALLILILPATIREHGWSGAVYGIAAMGFGAGLMLGSSAVLRDLTAERGRIGSPVRVGMSFALVANVALVAVTVVDHPVVMVLVLVTYGLLLGPVGPLLSGYRRSQTPRSMNGVVVASVRLLLVAPEPLSPLVVGLLAAVVGVFPALLLCGAVTAAVPAVGLMRLGALEGQAGEIRSSE